MWWVEAGSKEEKKKKIDEDAKKAKEDTFKRIKQNLIKDDTSKSAP